MTIIILLILGAITFKYRATLIDFMFQPKSAGKPSPPSSSWPSGWERIGISQIEAQLGAIAFSLNPYYPGETP
jgi:hypothetical protein